MKEIGKPPKAIVFEVTSLPEGGYSAKAVGHSIFTEGEDWEELKAMAHDAVRCHFDVDDVSTIVHLNLQD